MDNVPVKHYQRMQRRYPQLMVAVEALGTAATTAGPLTERVHQLVQLGAAAALRSGNLDEGGALLAHA